MFEVQTAQSLLRLDPDLGELMSAERRAAATRTLRVSVVSLRPGRWRPDALGRANHASSIGLLVLAGAILCNVRLLDTSSAELFGPGDIIRTWHADATADTLTDGVEWHALSQVHLAILDSSTALALRHYPEVMSMVLDRLHARAERLTVTQAISQVTGVDTRIEAMLRHLSQRWGRVGTHGVTVGLPLSHRILGSLVGARRPTVSTALATLAAERRVIRQSDGSWLLPSTASTTGIDTPVIATATLEQTLAA
ncbi:helix-turn-helix domain-containing protein [Solirubrobacter soli]|uniref:helix-turn-helix domain-containing protein n=1 Tax=Solirubrobacter soli TaxID=363832 RepID=UPI00042795F2|nr:Crp/Fnr family transcriptional regulator [Solirubrobacter soli]